MISPPPGLYIEEILFDENISTEEIINEIKKSYSNIEIKYKNIKICAQSVPFSIEERHVFKIKIFQNADKILMVFKKKKAFIAYQILLTEFFLNRNDIIDITINNISFKNNKIFFFNKLEYWNEIIIQYNNEQNCINSSQTIYYIITPYKHDNYYFNKEYDRIKNSSKFWINT